MKRRFLAMLVTVAMLAVTLTPIGAMAADPVVTKTYYDIDFENWTTQGDNNFGDGGKQSNGELITHEWGANPWQMTSTTVDDRDGKVMKVSVPTSGGSNYLFRTRMRSANQPSNYNGTQILWNEFAIKYEVGFAGFSPNENTNAYSIISVNKNGQLAIGARWGYNEVGSEGNFDAGTIIPDVQLELGNWYNIAVAADFTDADAGSSGVPTSVWINGEKISEGIRIPEIKPGYGWDYTKLFFDQAENTACTAYIDDIKIYETNIIGTHIENAYKVDIKDDNSDDYITLDGTNIKTPSRATIADVKAAFPEVTFKFEKDDAPVTDDTMSVSGVTAYVYSPNGLASKAYTLTPDSVLYTITVDGSNADDSGAGDYSVGDAVTIDAGSSVGQKFTGWTTEGIQLADPTRNPVSFIMYAGAKTFTANWEAVPTYAVEVIDSSAQTSGAGQYYAGQNVVIDAGEREGYTFGGWIVEGIENIDTTSETIEFVMDTVPKKFTAIWNEIPKYKVTVSGSYAADSGAGEYYEGETVTIKAGDTKKAEFKRWTATGVTISNASSATTSFKMPANDVSITATWSSYSAPSGGGGGGGSVSTPSFKINFETNGGSLVDAVSAKKGDSITLATPTKENFSFDGWYLDSALTQKVSSPYEVSGNVTLFAKWADKTEVGGNDAPEKDEDDWLNPFNDVKESSWYFEPIKYMYQRQYCEGFGWGQFGPDVNLSRAMLVTILYRIEEQPEVSGSSSFADVEDGSWYEAAVKWAADNGIVTGYNNNSFAPNDLITREQIATILYRYAQLKGKNVSESADISAFDDSNLVSSYAHSSLAWTVAMGYLNGRTETTIAPADYATRAEALTVLYRFIKE